MSMPYNSAVNRLVFFRGGEYDWQGVEVNMYDIFYSATPYFGTLFL